VVVLSITHNLSAVEKHRLPTSPFKFVVLQILLFNHRRNHFKFTLTSLIPRFLPRAWEWG